MRGGTGDHLLLLKYLVCEGKKERIWGSMEKGLKASVVGVDRAGRDP